MRELKRQINSGPFERLALSTDKEGVLALARNGHQPGDGVELVKDPYVFEFLNLPERRQFKKEENTEGDQEPIGIVLAADKDEILVEYTTGSISNQIFVSRYKTYLPNRKELAYELAQLLGKGE